MVINTDPVIAKAEDLLERLGSLDEIRRYYEAREMAIHDEITRITGARAEGEAEGITKGITKGTLDVARRMLSRNLPDDMIVDVTGLAQEQIEKLKTEVALS